MNLGLKIIDREVVLVKICNDLLPTAITLQKWKWVFHDNCCLCEQQETRDKRSYDTLPSTITKKIENQNNNNIIKTNKPADYKVRPRKYNVLCNSWMVEILRHDMESGSNKLETNSQWKSISTLAGAPREYKNLVRKSSNGFYLVRINYRDLFMYDDWALGNKKWRNPWQGQNNKAAKEESQGSNQCLSLTRSTRTSAF